MTKERTGVRPVVEKASDAGSPTRVAVLAVGDTRQWDTTDDGFPRTVNVAFASIEDITEEFLAIIEPEMVISPLLARSFDCADLAGRLHMFAYRGRYRAVADDIPNPALIRREVCDAFPGIDFDIISGDRLSMDFLS